MPCPFLIGSCWPTLKTAAGAAAVESSTAVLALFPCAASCAATRVHKSLECVVGDWRSSLCTRVHNRPRSPLLSPSKKGHLPSAQQSPLKSRREPPPSALPPPTATGDGAAAATMASTQKWDLDELPYLGDDNRAELAAAADVVLICQNGEELPAHSAFLMRGSRVGLGAVPSAAPRRSPAPPTKQESHHWLLCRFWPPCSTACAAAAVVALPPTTPQGLLRSGDSAAAAAATVTAAAACSVWRPCLKSTAERR